MGPSSASSSNSKFRLREEDVVRMVIEFLSNRELSISQLALERETGVVNGTYSEDLLFLRQLTLDGQWDDVLQFIQPLEGVEDFASSTIRYLVMKHKYMELLCIRSEAGPFQNVEVAVSEVVDCLNQLEALCPSKEDYTELCLLLTLPSLSDDPQYKKWNPNNSRLSCFKQMLPLVEKYLPIDKRSGDSMKTARNDRLLQLVIKGILYESCVEYCQKRATATYSNDAEMSYASLLAGTGFSDADLSLLSWLQSIPPETFSYPFEQKTLNVDVEQLEKPSLVASWSEMILITPIKPKVFPHSATPFTRVKAADLMSKSLTPGLVDGLSRSLMTISVGDVAAMSRSSMAAAGFHLSGGPGAVKRGLQNSVDKLFEDGDVFSSSCVDVLPTIKESLLPSPSCGKSPVSPGPGESSKKREKEEFESSARLKSNGASISTSSAKNDDINSSGLWKEFQKQKKHLLDKLQAEEEAFACSPRNAQNNSVSSKTNYNFPDAPKSNMYSTPPFVAAGDSNYLTPVNQVGQSNFPHPNKLTTSTPKGNYLRNKGGISPHQSPIFPGNNTQRTISFDNTDSTISCPQSHDSVTQSFQRVRPRSLSMEYPK